MVTITLPPELERAVTERAQQQGTTPEVYLLAELHERYLSEVIPDREVQTDETMADFLKDFIGCIDSREIVPGGANMSEFTGRRFGEILRKKHEEGKL